jgi:hypothetical protein
MRDEWMLAPSTKPTALEDEHSRTSAARSKLPTGDESLTEDYGESTASGRTLGKDIDFFSSMGTERKRKMPPEKPAVSFYCFIISCCADYKYRTSLFLEKS